jgi:two-component system chemotaxis response regulator CheY
MSATDSAAKTVLVVEDEPVARDGLAAILRRHGYTVFAAEHGQRALDLLLAGAQPDLILLDMLMPVLDGWRFLQLLPQTPAPAPPVVITTGTILTREWARDNGCAGFVKKPIEADALLAEVGRCLGV